MAAVVQLLSQEIDAVNRLQTELQAAEKNRLIGISIAMAGVILAIVVAVVMMRTR